MRSSSPASPASTCLLARGAAAPRRIAGYVALARQDSANVRCTMQIAFRLREWASGGLLQMRALRVNHDFIERVYTKPGEKVHAHAQSDTAQQIHHFVEAERARVAQQTVRAPDLVLDDRGRIAHEHVARVLLVADDLRDDLLEVLDQVLFALAEGGLVRDLEEVADDFRPLAVESPERQAEL